jgi:hypothetical protein
VTAAEVVGIGILVLNALAWMLLAVENEGGDE